MGFGVVWKPLPLSLSSRNEHLPFPGEGERMALQGMTQVDLECSRALCCKSPAARLVPAWEPQMRMWLLP